MIHLEAYRQAQSQLYSGRGDHRGFYTVHVHTETHGGTQVENELAFQPERRSMEPRCKASRKQNDV